VTANAGYRRRARLTVVNVRHRSDLKSAEELEITYTYLDYLSPLQYENRSVRT
jgi:hypothetical protein